MFADHLFLDYVLVLLRLYIRSALKTTPEETCFNPGQYPYVGSFSLKCQSSRFVRYCHTRNGEINFWKEVNFGQVVKKNTMLIRTLKDISPFVARYVTAARPALPQRRFSDAAIVELHRIVQKPARRKTGIADIKSIAKSLQM